MLKTINTRRSVRKFKPTPVSDKDIHDLLEAAMNAPSAVNEQAWQFVVMSGKVLDEFLTINSNTPKSAPVAILVCQDLTAEKAKGYSVQDCAAATQNILLAAHAKGLSTVWSTVFPNNAKAIRSLLNIPESVQPFSCVPVGYSAEGEKNITSRFDERKVHHQSW
ncbi:MAG TPA: nitroreductase family protein [Nitrospirota bacterium]|nr:nitroreductase family protein [Nitrospirota bacterium]